MALPIRTERLVVREYREDDLDDIARIFGDPLLAPGDEKPLTRVESRDWIRDELEHFRRDGIGRYAVAWPDSDEVIGGCGLVRRELETGVEVELGYHLRNDLWGRGLATEAALACLDEAQELALPRVIAFIEPGNARSGAVLRRIGMRPETTCDWFGTPHVRWGLDLGGYRSSP
jgi:[ribosomal protein S5]-alanine N-acetyltransferase